MYDGQGRYEEILTARDCYDVDEPLEEMLEPNEDDDEDDRVNIHPHPNK